MLLASWKEKAGSEEYLLYTLIQATVDSTVALGGIRRADLVGHWSVGLRDNRQSHAYNSQHDPATAGAQIHTSS